MLLLSLTMTMIMEMKATGVINLLVRTEFLPSYFT
jgi:hypothetical protein